MKRFYRIGAIALFLIMLSAYVSADLDPFKWISTQRLAAVGQDSTIVLEDRVETWRVKWLIHNYQTDSTEGDTINCQWAQLKEQVGWQRMSTSKSRAPLIEVEELPVKMRKTPITVVLPLKQALSGEEKILKVTDYPFVDEDQLFELLNIER